MTDSFVSDKPLWTPSPQRAASSLMAQFARKMEAQAGKAFPDYDSLWRWSVDQPEAFWSAVWDFCGVIGEKGSLILKDGGKMPGAQFFPEAKLNWAENLLKRRDDGLALVFLDEKGRERYLTYHELASEVGKVQQILKAQGVVAGDRVAGYMPNMPETLIAALAATSLGAVWSSASPDFGVQGVLDRFGQIEPKVLFTVDGYFYNGKTVDCLEKLGEIVPKIPSVRQVIVVPFAADRPDISHLPGAANYHDLVSAQKAHDPEFVRVAFTHPLFIMFSSGTTGIPKCIVHGHGGTLLQHLKEHQLHCDVHKDSRVFYFTTCGWMMWNWQVSALASGATLMLYDGSPFYPDPHVLWSYAERHKCTLFGTGAKYIDALKANGVRPKDSHDLSAVGVLTSTGSPLVHESFDYVYDAIKADLHLASISGGTDIVSCFVLGNPVSPVWRGEIQGPGLGMAVDVFGEDGKALPPGAGSGELVCTKPFPSMPTGFWNDADGTKYRKAYFERFDNVWCHGDWIERTAHNGLIIHGRSDATLNPGGVRIGTAEIYRQVEQIPEVLESIAVGQAWDNDERVLLFVRLKDGVTLTEDIAGRIKTQIRKGASPRHVPAKIVQVSDIPRTKSNKIVELAVRDVIHNRPVRNVEALANPEALDLYRGLTELAS
jgi:acetoacetyl-CoA synthetase